MSDQFFSVPAAEDLLQPPDAAAEPAGSGSSPAPEAEPGCLSCKAGFLSLLDTHFLICNEKISGKGEDSGLEAYTCENGIAAVLDGCGGLGAAACPGLSGRTEAYLASRAVGGAVKQWFEENAARQGSWETEALKNAILANLELCQSCSGNPPPKLKGSMVRPFPSTMALVLLRIIGGKLVTDHFWAGDSRTYVLEPEGLAQISRDDIRGEDAMSNLTRDGALTNVISADGRFVLHRTQFIPRRPCIVFCATDGCFGYVSSPMEFELLLLSSLAAADCAADWQQALSRTIADRSGDDQSLAAAVFGFSDFDALKAAFLDRYRAVSEIVSRFEQEPPENRQHLWEAYKPDYYRYTASKE